MQNSVISTRNTSHQGSQTPPVVLCMQNNVISIRNTSLYRYHPSSVAFACKTATFGSEFQVSMGPRHHLSFCAKKNRVISGRITSLHGCQTSLVVLCMQNSLISTRNTSLHGSQTSQVALCKQNNVISVWNTFLYGSQPSSVAFPCKTPTFELELQVSMGPRFRLLIWECKKRAQIQNDGCLLVPAFICGLCIQNSDFSIRITNLHGSQTSPMVFLLSKQQH